jgi:transcriptional regulator with XRE-family HTH domain
MLTYKYKNILVYGGSIMSVAEFVKKHRLAKNYKKQMDLSDRCYIAQGHLSRIESGLTDPQETTLNKLAIGLDVTYSQIYTSALPKENLTPYFIEHLEKIYIIDTRIKNLLVNILTRILNGDMILRIGFIEKFSKISSHYARIIDTRIEEYLSPFYALESKTDFVEIESVRVTCIIIEKLIYYKSREETAIEFEELLTKENETNSDSYFDFIVTPLYLDNVHISEKEKYIAIQLIRALRNTNFNND